jgi:murein DD-endopeptidase MepM/ murein hydrolase activator NlpD
MLLKRTLLLPFLASALFFTGISAGCATETEKHVKQRNLPKEYVQILRNVEYYEYTDILLSKLSGLPRELQIHETTLDYLKKISADGLVTRSEIDGLGQLDHDKDGLTLDDEKRFETDPLKPNPGVKYAVPVQTFAVRGIAYHDYNANLVKDQNEPTVSGINLKFISEDGNFQDIKTDVIGAYNIQLARGRYKISVGNNVLGYNDQPYRYLNNEPKGSYQRISVPLEIDLIENTDYDIRLLQGIFSLPISREVGANIFYYYDVDKRDGVSRDWNGMSRTYDQHFGTDFILGENTPILSPAPGIVFDKNWNWPGGGNALAIRHNDGLLTIYAHLNKIFVNVGDKVNRGDEIALSGNTGTKTSGPHLHFQMNVDSDLFGQSLDNRVKLIGSAIDFYRDVNSKLSKSYWTVDNNPQYSE